MTRPRGTMEVNQARGKVWGAELSLAKLALCATTTRGQTLTLINKCAKKVVFKKWKKSQEVKGKVVEGFVYDQITHPQVPHFTKSPKCHDFFKGTSPGTTSANYRSGKERKAAGVFWALWCALHPVSHLILYNPVFNYVKQHYLFFIHEEIFYRWLRPREVNSHSITQSV